MEKGNEKKQAGYRECDRKGCGKIYATAKHKEGEAAIYRAGKYCSAECQKEAREALSWNFREQA